VADKMAKETAKVDDALKALNAAPSSRLFQIDDSGAGANPNAAKADVTADPTGELSKDLGGGAGPGKKPGIAGAGDATSKQVATGLEKDNKVGSQKVDVEAHEKKQQVVRVGSSGGDAEGELPKAVIKSYIATKMGAIKACYQKGLQSNPDLTGKVKVAFLIQPSGAVLGARVDDSSMNNSSVEECILNNVKAWHFPPAKGGGSTKVTYPFQFSSTH
jgi:TonB family protein